MQEKIISNRFSTICLFNFLPRIFMHIYFCTFPLLFPLDLYFIDNSNMARFRRTSMDQIVTSVLYRTKLNQRASNAAVNLSRQFLSEWISGCSISQLKCTSIVLMECLGSMKEKRATGFNLKTRIRSRAVDIRLTCMHKFYFVSVYIYIYIDCSRNRGTNDLDMILHVKMNRNGQMKFSHMMLRFRENRIWKFVKHTNNEIK